MRKSDVLEEVTESRQGKAILTASEMDVSSLLESTPKYEFEDFTDHPQQRFKILQIRSYVAILVMFYEEEYVIS